MIQNANSSEFELQLLDEAIKHPNAAIMRLSIEVSREVRKLLSVYGKLSRGESLAPVEALKLLEGQLELSPQLLSAVEDFWRIRNFVLHETSSAEQHNLRALDYGLRVLKLIRSLPRPSFTVVNTDVPLYADSNCLRLRENVKGVIIQASSASGEAFAPQIYPSRMFYSIGLKVSWEWDLGGTGWDDTWYRKPGTEQIEMAWSESLEFIGRDINDI